MVEFDGMTEDILNRYSVEIPEDNADEEEIEFFKSSFIEAMQDAFDEWMECPDDEVKQERFAVLFNNVDDVIHNPYF